MMYKEENWVSVAKSIEVPPGCVFATKIGDQDIAIYNINGEYFSTHNVCTHAHVLLSEGWLEGDIIECPLHGGRFEVKTGKGLGAPITCDLRTFETRIVGEEIQVLARVQTHNQ